jgi:hypothetical protein
MNNLAEKLEIIEQEDKVIIPRVLWEEIKELAEHIYLYGLIKQRKDKPALIELNKLLEEEGLTREDLEG